MNFHQHPALRRMCYELAAGGWLAFLHAPCVNCRRLIFRHWYN